MSSERSQNTRSTHSIQDQSYSYILAKNMWKQKLKYIPFTHSIKFKYLVINLIKQLQDLDAILWRFQNTNERNQKTK